MWRQSHGEGAVEVAVLRPSVTHLVVLPKGVGYRVGLDALAGSTEERGIGLVVNLGEGELKDRPTPLGC